MCATIFKLSRCLWKNLSIYVICEIHVCSVFFSKIRLWIIAVLKRVFFCIGLPKRLWNLLLLIVFFPVWCLFDALAPFLCEWIPLELLSCVSVCIVRWLMLQCCVVCIWCVLIFWLVEACEYIQLLCSILFCVVSSLSQRSLCSNLSLRDK